MTFTLAVVGAGVRGTQVLLRLADAVRADGETALDVDVHVIDPWPDGAGRTWRTDQSPLLLMNGPARDVTAFPEAAGVPAAGGGGPDLATWCRLAAAGEVDGVAEAALAEARAVDESTFVPRALYGHYLRWAFDRAVAALPPGMRVHRRAARAVSYRPRSDAGAVLDLSDGTSLAADAAVLALGWLPAIARAVDGATARHRWVRAAHPADQDLEVIRDGEPVIVRGLGMGFFDSAILLTQGRGGRFEPVSRASPDLVYVPSGREPRLIAGSRRGVPYRSKPLRGAAAAHPHEAIERLLAGPAPSDGWDFESDILPAIHRDATRAYYATLARHRPAAVAGGVGAFLDRLRAAADEDVEAVIARHITDPADRLDLGALEDPAGTRRWAGAADVQAWVAAYIEADLAETEPAGRSALKAAARSLGEARPAIAPLVEFSGLTAASLPAYRRFMAFGAMLSGGPPTVRSRQLLALHRAGVVTFVGPGTRVAADTAGPGRETYRAWSDSTPTVEYRAGVLLDAWLDPPTAQHTADRFLASLIASGRARPHRIDGIATGALEVERSASRVVAASGEPSPHLFSVGIPSEGQRVFTILSPRPGAPSAIAAECAATARAVAGLIREASGGRRA